MRNYVYMLVTAIAACSDDTYVDSHTAMVEDEVLVVRRGAKKVFEVHCASDSTVQFGRGRGCVLVGVMGGSKIVVHSVKG